MTARAMWQVTMWDGFGRIRTVAFAWDRDTAERMRAEMAALEPARSWMIRRA